MEILVVLMLVLVVLATFLISPIAPLYLSKEQVEKLLDISYILVLFLVILAIYNT